MNNYELRITNYENRLPAVRKVPAYSKVVFDRDMLHNPKFNPECSGQNSKFKIHCHAISQ